jgi:hypothetical protein
MAAKKKAKGQVVASKSKKPVKVSTAAKPTKPPAKAKPAPPARSNAVAKPPAAASSDWRLATLDRMRRLIVEADPEMVEERKWVKRTNPLGVPVFSHGGIVCTGEKYKAAVKLTFMYGASLPDPTGLFNAGFGGGTRRAIDIPEGHQVDAKAFKALIQAAVAYNLQRSKKR